MKRPDAHPQEAARRSRHCRLVSRDGINCRKERKGDPRAAPSTRSPRHMHGPSPGRDGRAEVLSGDGRVCAHQPDRIPDQLEEWLYETRRPPGPRALSERAENSIMTPPPTFIANPLHSVAVRSEKPPDDGPIHRSPARAGMPRPIRRSNNLPRISETCRSDHVPSPSRRADAGIGPTRDRTVCSTCQHRHDYAEISAPRVALRAQRAADMKKTSIPPL